MKKKKNAGFSLIEIVIGLAVASIVGTLVSSFMLFGLKSYGKTTDEVSLQEQAQVTLSQMNNYIMDGDATITYYITTINSGTSNTDAYKNDVEATGGNTNVEMTVKEIEVGSADKDGGIVYDVLIWRKADKAVYYKQRNKDAAGNKTDISDEELLASNVEDFSVDLTKVEDVREVYLNISMSKNQKSYLAERTVHLRNNIIVQTQPQTPTDPDSLVITNVEVTPVVVERLRGESCGFQAKVYPDIEEFQNVKWTLEEKNSDTTTIEPNSTNPMYAVVKLGDDETATEIKVRATAIDPSGTLTNISAVATIKVKEPTPEVEVTGVTVTPNPVTKYKGETQQFTAVVEGNNNPPQTVDWSVEGNLSENTYISSNGLLTIGEDEDSKTLIVRATSTFYLKDGSAPKSGTAVCYVKSRGPYGDAVVIYKDECKINSDLNAHPDQLISQVDGSLPNLDLINTVYSNPMTLTSPANNAQSQLQNAQKAQKSAGPLIINYIDYDITTPAIIANGDITINVSSGAGDIVIGSPDKPVLLAALNGGKVIFNVPSGCKVTFYGIAYMTTTSSTVLNDQGGTLEVRGMIISNSIIKNNNNTHLYRLDSVSDEGGLLDQLCSQVEFKVKEEKTGLQFNGDVVPVE